MSFPSQKAGYEESDPAAAEKKLKASNKDKKKKKSTARVEEPPAKKAKVAAAGVIQAQGDSDIPLRFCVEYAKSGRSKCKGCGSAIEKGVVRLGKVVKNPFVEKVTNRCKPWLFCCIEPKNLWWCLY